MYSICVNRNNCCFVPGQHILFFFNYFFSLYNWNGNYNHSSISLHSYKQFEVEISLFCMISKAQFLWIELIDTFLAAWNDFQTLWVFFCSKKINSFSHQMLADDGWILDFLFYFCFRMLMRSYGNSQLLLT